MDSVVRQVEEPGLFLVPLHEADCFIGEDVGREAVDLLHVAAPVDKVFRVGGGEFGFAVLAEGVVVAADEEAEEFVEAAGLGVMLGAEALMPFADEAGGIAGP